MGRLRLSPQESIELDGFPLEAGDGIAILLLGSWVSGIIGHDERGWYLLTKERRGVRLQTGLMAYLLSLEILPEQSWARMSERVFSEDACSPRMDTSQRLRSSPASWCDKRPAVPVRSIGSAFPSLRGFDSPGEI